MFFLLLLLWAILDHESSSFELLYLKLSFHFIDLGVCQSSVAVTKISDITKEKVIWAYGFSSWSLRSIAY